jgi:hypothetical protein
MNEQEEQSEAPVEQGRPRGLEIVGVVILIVAIGLSLSYAWRERSQALQLAASRDQLRASLNQTQAQVDALTAKLNSMSAIPPAAPATVEPTSTEAHTASAGGQPAPEKVQHRSTKHPSIKHKVAHRADDPRWKKVEAQLAENQKRIQETQENLQKTRTDLEGNLKSSHDELSGSIAKNHEELVELQRHGQRNYYEFDLSKSKGFKRIGPISVSLRKANSKREYCDLAMLVNDNPLSKKHVNLYEPVLFYPQGYVQPLELVINQINKDGAHGYVSEPKYKQPAQAASATTATPPASSSTATATLDHRPATDQQ